MKTAESVTPMHPDKICDQISDAILDECLRQDPNSRVAIETMGGHGIITVTGELTTKAFVDVREIVKKIVGEKYGVQVNIVKQSPIIAKGVDNGGAGDQGIMVGYACTDNDDMIPQELYLARSLCKFLYELYPYDGKTQITLDNDNRIKTIVASFQNTKSQNLSDAVGMWLLQMSLKGEKTEGIQVFANPGGDWDLGGFEADTGLTGRKLAVDNYGPQVPIGGGCFSGKDASKVDRSGAYMARKIAVETMIQFQARECIVKIAYAIGVAKPVMATAYITQKDGIVSEHKISEENIEKYLTPNKIKEILKLNEPQFQKTAEWGHFGNNFPWDK